MPVKRGRHVVANEELAEDRLVDAAQDGLPLVKERDQGAEEGDARREGLRAVDGIDNPDERGFWPLGAELLANDPVGRVPCCDQVAHQLLGAPIRGGHGGLVGLQLHLEVRFPEVGAYEIAAQLGKLDHEIPVGSEVHPILQTAIRMKDTKN